MSTRLGGIIGCCSIHTPHGHRFRQSVQYHRLAITNFIPCQMCVKRVTSRTSLSINRDTQCITTDQLLLTDTVVPSPLDRWGLLDQYPSKNIYISSQLQYSDVLLYEYNQAAREQSSSNAHAYNNSTWIIFCCCIYYEDKKERGRRLKASRHACCVFEFMTRGHGDNS